MNVPASTFLKLLRATALIAPVLLVVAALVLSGMFSPAQSKHTPAQAVFEVATQSSPTPYIEEEQHDRDACESAVQDDVLVLASERTCFYSAFIERTDTGAPPVLSFYSTAFSSTRGPPALTL